MALTRACVVDEPPAGIGCGATDRRQTSEGADVTHAWLVLQVAALAAVVAGVALLAGLAWALIAAGVLGAVVAEMKS